MIADFLTKPLQGKAFVKFWDLLMEQFDYIWDRLYFNLGLAHCWGHRCTTGVCWGDVDIVAGITKLGEKVAGNTKLQ